MAGANRRVLWYYEKVSLSFCLLNFFKEVFVSSLYFNGGKNIKYSILRKIYLHSRIKNFFSSLHSATGNK